jgi:DNA-binding HxlR family transcriptional regulator
MIDKHSFDGYPLKVKYFLTDSGRRLLEAVTIMQNVGIELMKENGMEDVLKANGLLD